MPTIRVLGDNEIQFLDANGDVVARQRYDSETSGLRFEDVNGNLIPVQLGSQTIDDLSTASITDIDDGTKYDVGDDLAKGAFTDEDEDGVYTLPQPSDEISLSGLTADTAELTTIIDSDNDTSYSITDELAAATDIYFQESEPAETPAPAPGGDGGLWYQPKTIPAGSKRFGPLNLTSGEQYETRAFGSTNNVFFVRDGFSSIGGLSPSGEVLWRRVLGPEDGAASDGKFFYYGGFNAEAAFGVDAVTGEILWEQPSVTDGINSSSAFPVVDGVVIFNTGQGLFGLDASDGTVLYNDLDPDRGDVLGGGDGVVIFESTNGEIEARNPTNNVAEWTFSYNTQGLGGTAESNGLAISDGIVVFATRSGAIYGLDAADGTELWRNTENEVTSSPAIFTSLGIVGGKVGAASNPIGESGSTFRRLDLQDGTTVSSSSFTQPQGVVKTGSDEFVLLYTGSIFVIDAQSGQERASVNVEFPSKQDTAVSDDKTLFVYEDFDGMAGYEIADQLTYEPPRVSDGTQWVGKR